jgi:EmrB/QacA subfamily drug resistance transporter
MLTSSQNDLTLAAPNSPHDSIKRWQWNVLALVSATFFIVVLDFSVVNVALAAIQTDLKFAPVDLQWVATAYAITFGGFLLLGGRCADLMGRRKVLLAGVIVFTLASLLAGLSGIVHIHAQGMLIACRGLQGLGGAFIAPAALAIVNTTFAEGAQRNRALGVFASIASAGFACGNLLGGVLTGHFGWPSIFFINVPLGILLLVLAPRLVPTVNDVHAPLPLSAGRLDIGGALTVTLGLIALVYASVGIEQGGWTSPRTLIAFGGAFSLLAAFVYIESKVADPLMPLTIFQHPMFAASNIIMLLIEGINGATFLFISLYLQQVKGLSPQATGFTFLPLALWMLLASNLTPRIITRYGTRPVLIWGTIFTTLSPLLLSRITAESSYYYEVQPILFIAGAGMAAANTGGFIAATTGLADEDQGLASGIVQTSQQIGAAIGLALLVAVATAYTEASRAVGATPIVSQLAGLQAAFLIGALLSGISCFVAIFGTPKRTLVLSESN